MDESKLSSGSLITTAEASKLSGYAKDYIGQLCRLQKIRGRLFGKRWLVDTESLLKFVEFSKTDVRDFTFSRQSVGEQTPKKVESARLEIETLQSEKSILKEAAIVLEEQSFVGKSFSPNTYSADSSPLMPKLASLAKAEKIFEVSKKRPPVFSPRYSRHSDLFPKLGALALSVTLVFGTFFLSRTEYPARASQKLTAAFSGIEAGIFSGASALADVLSPERIRIALVRAQNNLARYASVGASTTVRSASSFFEDTLSVARYTAESSRDIATSFLTDPKDFTLSLAEDVSKNVSHLAGSLHSAGTSVAAALESSPELFSSIVSSSRFLGASVWSSFTNTFTKAAQSLAVGIYDTVNHTVETLALGINNTVNSVINKTSETLATLFTSPSSTNTPNTPPPVNNQDIGEVKSVAR